MEQVTFLGASVRSFTSNIGWGLQPSQLTVQLVEDNRNGDEFDPPDPLTPVYFQYYNFYFGGLLQKWTRKKDTSGMPVYEVIVTDPRELLEAAQVIIGAYYGTVGGVKNLFNAFGFWEDQGYGLSNTNESGMPWNLIKGALHLIANTPVYGTFGGPLTLKGYAYSLGLSEVPSPAPYYRIGGTSLSLLELISQVCEDNACDFFVELVGQQIRVRTVSRLLQPPLGTITALTEAYQGSLLVRSSSGLEGRNELTSAFVIGGEVSTLYETITYNSFWGYDLDGLPILGTSSLFPLIGASGDVFDVLADESFGLNAAPVSDVLATTTYDCTLTELRVAKANQPSWETFISNYRPDVASLLGIGPAFQFTSPNGPATTAADTINDGMSAQNSAMTDDYIKRMRVYSFVRGYADEYMGRKWAVSLPLVSYKTDSDTLKLTTSYEIADAGYLPDGADPLGLSQFNQDIFETQDGRIRAFARFGASSGIDLTQLSVNNTVFEDGLLYQDVQVDPHFIFTDTGPAAVVTLPGAITEKAQDIFGGVGLIAGVLGTGSGAQMEEIIKYPGFGANQVKMAPAIVYPEAFAIPLKSNVLTYGPWYAQGAPGKVRVEIDPSLTPWNYGGYTALDVAGFSRATQAVTNMQVAEEGVIELVGTPLYSLGDVLQANGPNLTNIDVSIGPQGVTTTYRMHTFTPRFGSASKAMNDRLKKAALLNVQMRRTLRASIKNALSYNTAVSNANRTHIAFMALAPAMMRRESPLPMLIGHSVKDGSKVRVGISCVTNEEGMQFCSPASGEYENTTMMSWTGLIRPFSTQPGFNSNTIPSFASYGATGDIMTAGTLNPWKSNNDVEFYTHGDTFPSDGIHAYQRGADYAKARVFGLRGPLVVVGWGRDIAGGSVGSITNQYTWKAGPVDLLWHPYRGVWTPHGIVKGTISAVGDVVAGGSCSLQINSGGSGAYNLTVYNFSSSTTISSPNGKRAMAGYVADENRWYIMSLDC